MPTDRKRRRRGPGKDRWRAARRERDRRRPSAGSDLPGQLLFPWAHEDRPSKRGGPAPWN